MALIKINFFSEALGMNSSMYVAIPQKSTVGQIGANGNESNEKFKSLILLHGLSDDESIWLRRTSVERYASNYPLAVIMPCGHRSFYTDMKHGGKYYTYISKEVPRIAREFLNISDRYEDSFIGGISMGGYGALKIALRENTSFSKVFALSPVSDIEHRKEQSLAQNFRSDFINIFGEDLNIPDEDNLFKLTKQKKESNEKLPETFLACGTDDFMFDDYVNFKKHLDNIKYFYDSYECKESHRWEFWDAMIKKSIDWIF